MPYQPAVGVWASSPQRRVLWATMQVLDKIERQSIGEDQRTRAWAAKIERQLVKPVAAYDWNGMLRKAEEPRVPDDVVTGLGAVERMIPELWLESATLATSLQGLPFDPADLDAAVGNVGRMVSSLPDTAAARLQTIMRDVYAQAAAGGNVSQFDYARRIRAEWKVSSRAKAEQIAVTEWRRASAGATVQAYARQGIRSKVWITVGDMRVCPVCTANASEGEIPMGDEFVGGESHPPQHPSCRCSVAAGFS